MKTSSQPSARILSQLLVGHGVRDVVVSPGSRNAPLVVAVSATPELATKVVIDERVAGFVALGMAVQTLRPVALICTSGTALLNYAPAVAEAYYRCVPLIVISADRPSRWIDQDDSQTIRQFEALANIVNMSVDVSSDYKSADFVWFANRQINDALLAATSRRPGPVHINIQLDEPLGDTVEGNLINEAERRLISSLKPELTFRTEIFRELARTRMAPPAKILFVAGFMPPNDRMTRAMNKLASIPNIALFYEAQSNLHHVKRGFGFIDRLLSSCDEECLEIMKPDLVITVGGSLVSRMIKRWLRGSKGIRHWHVGIGPRERSIDVFQMLEKRIEADPALFMAGIASAMQPYKNSNSDYSQKWKTIASKIVDNNSNDWSDLNAIKTLVKGLDSKTNLHVSNGTSVRYLQLTDYGHLHRIEANRGVSGIDGSTSTAIGASFVYSGPTVLLTGDMSAVYDLGALNVSDIPNRFSMVVLNNGGGDIFRVIGSTRHLEMREELFCVPAEKNFSQQASCFGFEYLSASSFEELAIAMVRLKDISRKRPLLLELKTFGCDNASKLREYLGATNRLKL